MKAVHVAVTRQVKPGCESAFEEVLRVFARESLREPGTTGVHLIAPVPGAKRCEYGILRSFANDETSQRFYESHCSKSGKNRLSIWSSANPFDVGSMAWKHFFAIPGRLRHRAGKWPSSPGLAFFRASSFGLRYYRKS